MTPQSLQHPLPDELIELIAERFRALGDPTRIRILERLRGGPQTVQELVAELGTTQQNVSKHLGVLRALGMVVRRKDGGFSHYAIGDDTVTRLCDEVCGSLQRQVAELHHIIEGGAR